METIRKLVLSRLKTVSHVRMFVHLLLSVSESRELLLDRAFLQTTTDQRIITLTELLDQGTYTIISTTGLAENAVAPVVIQAIDNTQNMERASILEEYNQLFQASKYHNCWRNYIERFDPKIWNCNFSEFGYILWITHSNDLVYEETDLTKEYKMILANGGKYQWNLPENNNRDMIDGEPRQSGYAIAIDVRDFSNSKFNREDGETDLMSWKSFLNSAGFEIYKTEETNSRKWKKRDIEDILVDFRKECIVRKPKTVLVLLSSRCESRGIFLTSDFQRMSLEREIETLFHNVGDGSNLNAIPKIIFGYFDKSKPVTQTDSGGCNKPTSIVTDLCTVSACETMSHCKFRSSLILQATLFLLRQLHQTRGFVDITKQASGMLYEFDQNHKVELEVREVTEDKDFFIR